MGRSEGRFCVRLPELGHLLVLALGALFIFGPERLPTLARDAARGLTRLRMLIDDVRTQIGDELGDDVAELPDLRRYRPRRFLREELFGDAPSGTVAGSAGAFGSAGSTWSSAAAAGHPVGEVPLHRLAPPFDCDAT